LRKGVRREDVIKRLRDIAFGRSNDIVKLAFMDGDDGFSKIDGLDLALLSEVKRSSNGVVELKLSNRIEALKLLFSELEAEQKADGTDAKSFFEAMDRAAQTNDAEPIS